MSDPFEFIDPIETFREAREEPESRQYEVPVVPPPP